MKRLSSLFLFFIGFSFCLQAQDIALNHPDLTVGSSLMHALSERKTSRDFSDKPLTLQQISEVLWASGGINRADGKRTAPSSNGKNCVDVYVITADGIYLYQPENWNLKKLKSGDFRKYAGRQAFVLPAPLHLIYVADLAKLNGPRDLRHSSACLDAGHKAENVYLYCADKNLSVGTRVYIDFKGLADVLGLNADQEVLMAQSVGYAK